LPAADVSELATEIGSLRAGDIGCLDAQDAARLRHFLIKLDDLVRASLEFRKPIAF
jgi:hypothetical protein